MEEIPSPLTPQARSRSLLQFSCAYVWANACCFLQRYPGGRDPGFKVGYFSGCTHVAFVARGTEETRGSFGIEELHPPQKSCVFLILAHTWAFVHAQILRLFGTNCLLGPLRVIFAPTAFLLLNLGVQRNLPNLQAKVPDKQAKIPDQQAGIPNRGANKYYRWRFFRPKNVCTRQRQKYRVFDQRFKCLTPGSSRYVATNVKPGHNVEENGTLCSPQSVALCSWGLDHVLVEPYLGRPRLPGLRPQSFQVFGEKS